MKNRTDEYVRKLQNLYLFHVKKFVEALKRNAPQNELISIRKNAKEILDEIHKNSTANNTMKDSN